MLNEHPGKKKQWVQPSLLIVLLCDYLEIYLQNLVTIVRVICQEEILKYVLGIMSWEWDCDLVIQLFFEKELKFCNSKAKKKYLWKETEVLN